jgi:hypothetical protein
MATSPRPSQRKSAVAGSRSQQPKQASRQPSAASSKAAKKRVSKPPASQSLAAQPSKSQPSKSQPSKSKSSAAKSSAETSTAAQSPTPARVRKKPALPSAASPNRKVKLLSGDNPQIAKGDGAAPVQAYLEAIPGWKQAVAREVDQLIGELVPDVQRAVRWNSPFYGREGHGWIVAMHVFTKYVKVTFFNGQGLRPLPPGGTERSGNARWLDLREGMSVATSPLAGWIQQAARLPGWQT